MTGERVRACIPLVAATPDRNAGRRPSFRQSDDGAPADRDRYLAPRLCRSASHALNRRALTRTSSLVKRHTAHQTFSGIDAFPTRSGDLGGLRVRHVLGTDRSVSLRTKKSWLLILAPPAIHPWRADERARASGDSAGEVRSRAGTLRISSRECGHSQASPYEVLGIRHPARHLGSAAQGATSLPDSV